MAKSKYITHSCAYCQKVTKMVMVGEMGNESGESLGGKVWYRCTRCKHSSLIERPANSLSKNAVKELTRDDCEEYAQNKVFSVGQAIYHSDWDDVGTVVGKAKISSGVHAITVAFQKVGERRLIENNAIDHS